MTQSEIRYSHSGSGKFETLEKSLQTFLRSTAGIDQDHSITISNRQTGRENPRLNLSAMGVDKGRFAEGDVHREIAHGYVYEVHHCGASPPV